MSTISTLREPQPRRCGCPHRAAGGRGVFFGLFDDARPWCRARPSFRACSGVSSPASATCSGFWVAWGGAWLGVEGTRCPRRRQRRRAALRPARSASPAFGKARPGRRLSTKVGPAAGRGRCDGCAWPLIAGAVFGLPAGGRPRLSCCLAERWHAAQPAHLAPAPGAAGGGSRRAGRSLRRRDRRGALRGPAADRRQRRAAGPTR